MNHPASVSALFAHHPVGLAIVQATSTVPHCTVCDQPMPTHARCFWCTALLGEGHAEDVPPGWHPGDRRAIECNYCWAVRMRRGSRARAS